MHCTSANLFTYTKTIHTISSSSNMILSLCQHKSLYPIMAGWSYCACRMMHAAVYTLDEVLCLSMMQAASPNGTRRMLWVSDSQYARYHFCLTFSSRQHWHPACLTLWSQTLFSHIHRIQSDRYYSCTNSLPGTSWYCLHCVPRDGDHV